MPRSRDVRPERGGRGAARAVAAGAAALAWALAGASSCTGVVGEQGGANGPGAGSSAGASGGNLRCVSGQVSDPGPAISRRLTRTEYDNTVRDLLGDATAPATSFPAEELNLSFDNAPLVLTVSPLLAESYMDAAESLAAAYVTNLGAALPCSTAGGASCAEMFIRTFGARAFRRPVAADDVARYMTVFNAGAATDFASGIRLAVTAMLQSAPFLYRIETGGAPVAGTSYVKLTSWEIASRLSYLLWKTMPDDALTQAAAADQLQTPASVAAQAQRMLADPRAQAAVVDFHDQWLNLRRLGDASKDPGLFPSYTDAVTADMHTEATSLISDVLFGGNGDVSALFTAPYTFMNGNLAAFYGVPGVAGAGFQKVAGEPTRHAGILTLGALTAVLAKENQTSPPRRGNFIRQQILCESIPPPPMNLVITLPALDPSLTTRQRFSQHATDAACSICHQFMDSIGLSFENLDAVGRWRDSENGMAVDASGEITALGTATDPGLTGAYDGIPELGRKLAASPEVKGCLVTNWFRYAAARAETPADACALSSLKTQFAAGGYNMTKLLVALVQSDAFRYRRPLTDPLDPSLATQ